MRNFLAATLIAFGLGVGASQAADFAIKIRPPKNHTEHRSTRPSKNHVWIGGYQKWDGHAYGWQPGRWETPPRPHAVWVAPRYNHTRDGYVFAEGHWR